MCGWLFFKQVFVFWGEKQLSERAMAATPEDFETKDTLDTVHFVTDGSVDTPMVFLKDMDDDGDMDIVVTPHANEQSYWLENDLGKSAEGLFQHTSFRQITPTAIAFGDIDGDGTRDVIVGHSSGGKVFYNNGAWSSENLAVMLDSPRTILVEDIDGDGQADILIRDSQNLLLIKNTPDSLGTQVMSWPGLGDSSLLDVGNFNVTNTTLEILTMDMTTGSLAMISHNGMHWQAAQSVSTVSATSIVVQDLNGDGMDDIYIADSEGNHVWLEGDGTGGLIQHSVADNPPPMDSGCYIEPAAGETQTETTHTSGSYFSSFFGFGDTSTTLTSSFGPGYTLLTPPTSEGAASQTACRLSYESSHNEALASLDGKADTTLDYSDSDKAVSVILAEENPSDTPAASPKASQPPVQMQTLSRAPESPAEDLPAPEGEKHILHIIGSDYGDFLVGNSEGNIIAGGKGNDLIFGGNGDDTLAGQRGHDIIFSDGGDDHIMGGKGNDILFGGSGDDDICGGKDHDLMFGDTGDDFLHGESGDDVIFGDAGQDVLYGGAGEDVLFGGRGDDIIYGGTHADTLYGDSGNDTFIYFSEDEGGDCIADFTIGEDRFQFEFGEDNLYIVDGKYSGDLGISGEAFVWESISETSTTLYYDPDTDLAGDEIRLAQIDLSNDSATMDSGDIHFDDLIIS